MGWALNLESSYFRLRLLDCAFPLFTTRHPVLVGESWNVVEAPHVPGALCTPPQLILRFRKKTASLRGESTIYLKVVLQSLLHQMGSRKQQFIFEGTCLTSDRRVRKATGKGSYMLHSRDTHLHKHARTHTHTLADQSSRGMLFVLGLLVLVCFCLTTYLSILELYKPCTKRFEQVRGLGVPNPYHDKLERSSLGSAFQNVHCPPADMTAETVNPTLHPSEQELHTTHTTG